MKNALAYATLAILSAVVYSSILPYPFVFDDGMYIAGNAGIRDFSGFWPPVGTRYFGYLSFALSYSMGGLDPRGYHAVNILIHIVNSMLVFRLVSLTFKTPFMELSGLNDKESAAFGAALIASVLFAIHPVQTQAVTYTTQRFASLATLFFLLSLVLYASHRIGAEGGRKGYVKYALAFASAIAAQMTKEIAFTLPTVIVLYEAAFFGGGFRKRAVSTAPFMLTMLIIPFTLLVYAGPDHGVSELIREKQIQELSDLSPYQYLSTQFRVVVTYLRLVILPVGQNLDYDYPKFTSVLEPGPLLSLFFLLCFAAVAVVAYARTRMGRAPLAALSAAGVFWFFITLSIESSVIPIQDVIFEHRLYLPSIGLFVSFGAFMICLFEYLKKRSLVKASATVFAIVVAIILAIPYGVAAYRRNLVWQDEFTLWTDVARKSPGKTRPHNNLGDVYFRMGRYGEAIEEFEKARGLKPDVKTFFNLGSAYYKVGRYEEAEAELKTAIGLKPDFADAHYNLASTLRALGRMDEAVSELEKTVTFQPDKWRARYNLALAYQSMGRLSDAKREFEAVISINPGFQEAYQGIEEVGR